MFNQVWIALVATLIQFSFARFPDLVGKLQFIDKPLNNLDKPLILSSYIKEGKLKEAREAAEVHLEDFQDVISYSGYLTVDNNNNGNLFFWYFPSQNNYKVDPVLLWLNGGPGISSLIGLFTEHGPFVVLENGKVSLREFSWHKNYSIIYIDQPVGTGFSFTRGPLVNNQTQVGEHLYSGLVQFFTIFAELQANAFFVSGESYAGKYVPSISYAIHTKNPTADLKINLHGLLIGNGFSDPRHQMVYGDFLYQLGLIDKNILAQIQESEGEVTDAIDAGNYTRATKYWGEIIDKIQNATNVSISNFLKDSDDNPTTWKKFIVQDRVRKALHVGGQEYVYFSQMAYDALSDDITKSVAPWISELLSHYRVLIYNGQLDIIVAYAITVNYLQKLEFSGSKEYATADRNLWHVGNRTAGYVKTAGNLTEVLVRDAGHLVPTDQPEFAFDLLNKFVRNTKFA